MHTHGTEVHEAREGDDREVLAVDDVATIELRKELALNIWSSERNIE